MRRGTPKRRKQWLRRSGGIGQEDGPRATAPEEGGSQAARPRKPHAARVTEILDDVRAAAQSALNTDLTTSPASAGLRRPPAFTFKLDDPDDMLVRLTAAGRALLPTALGRRLVTRSARERLLAMTDRHAGRLRSALTERVREETREYADELQAAVSAACEAIRVAVACARDSHAGQREATERRLSDLAARERRCRELAAALQEMVG